MGILAGMQVGVRALQFLPYHFFIGLILASKGL